MLTDKPAHPVASNPSALDALYQRIFTFDDLDEAEVMRELMQQATLTPAQLAKAQALAARLAEGVRKARLDAGGVDLLTQEFTLDSREGVALMCLAEAMLRVPDTETRNKLIRDKIVDQDWRSHIGQSPSLFVNAAAWGLALTGKVLKQPDEQSLAAALSGVLRRGGEGVVRAGVSFAMRLLGKQFVTGQTIEEALSLARGREKLGYRYSYDMLGEAALTLQDANAYYESYAHTIEMVGRAADGQGPVKGPGVSVKLTGLHPRYEVAQHDRVIAEMYPKLLQLARDAKRWGLGFHLDQEEAARFPLTLEMLHRLAHEPELAGWDGLGISLQAYQKRGRAVAEWLIALARATNRRICVRLVKGAYWDTEIKRCQTEGAASFPVFTRKVHSDVSYVACAKLLLNAQDAVFPQFATHNAFSIAAAHTLGEGKDYEFQCLHGMGESVYDQVVGDAQLGRACRVYAPVGPHETLLAYLVRRLLENGANTSFVNQVVDPSVTIESIVADPVQVAAQTGGLAHPAVVLPRRLLPWRDQVPPAGITGALPEALPLSATAPVAATGRTDVAVALDVAGRIGTAWAERPLTERAAVLTRVAAALEGGSSEVQKHLLRESRLTLAEAGEELRSAAELCRLHAAQALADGSLAHAHALGPVGIIAPATSPLAWPVGQIAAALVTGNPVVLKPASTAPRTAQAIAALFDDAGLPSQTLQVLPGTGSTVGTALITHPGTSLVVLGASRAVAAAVADTLAASAHRPRLLARTTACNAMIVDSSALPEQVITDAVTGAFDGAGRRVSALKLLCLQDDVADKVLGMLRAMLDERQIGEPMRASSDIGPMADVTSCQVFDRYLGRLAQQGHTVLRGGRQPEGTAGPFAQPAIVELGRIDSLAHVDPDIVGPVLHIVRWSANELTQLLQTLDRQLMPATLGLHTRIFETAGEVLAVGRAGAVCVNRAVHLTRAGMQLQASSAADTGPSETGPFYLREFVRDADDDLSRTQGPFAANASHRSDHFLQYPVVREGRLSDRRAEQERVIAERLTRLDHLADLAGQQGENLALAKSLRGLVRRLAALSLPALSGEENTLTFEARGQVLCAGPSAKAALRQALYAVACGNRALLPADLPGAERFAAVAGDDSCRLVQLDTLARNRLAAPDVVLTDDLRVTNTASGLATLVAGGVPVIAADPAGRYAWWRLLRERLVSINASASGGNTQLMMMDATAV